MNTAAQVFTRPGYRVAAYLHREGISVIPYLEERQVLLRYQSQLLDTLDLVGLKLNETKSWIKFNISSF